MYNVLLDAPKTLRARRPTDMRRRQAVQQHGRTASLLSEPPAGCHCDACRSRTHLRVHRNLAREKKKEGAMHDGTRSGAEQGCAKHPIRESCPGLIASTRGKWSKFSRRVARTRHAPSANDLEFAQAKRKVIERRGVSIVGVCQVPRLGGILGGSGQALQAMAWPQKRTTDTTASALTACCFRDAGRLLCTCKSSLACGMCA